MVNTLNTGRHIRWCEARNSKPGKCRLLGNCSNHEWCSELCQAMKAVIDRLIRPMSGALSQ